MAPRLGRWISQRTRSMEWERSISPMKKIAASLVRNLEPFPRIICPDREEADQVGPGPSSNIAFMSHICRAIAQANTRNPSVLPTSPPNQRGGGMVNVSRSRPPSVGPSDGAKSAARVNIYALPPENRTWSLIRQYFYKTGQLLPWIHESSFCETYFQMKKENFTQVRRTWLGLLNIVLAIATSLSTEGDLPAEKRIQESDIYYQRANGLCDKDSKRNASLEMGE